MGLIFEQNEKHEETTVGIKGKFIYHHFFQIFLSQLLLSSLDLSSCPTLICRIILIFKPIRHSINQRLLGNIIHVQICIMSLLRFHDDTNQLSPLRVLLFMQIHKMHEGSLWPQPRKSVQQVFKHIGMIALKAKQKRI